MADALLAMGVSELKIGNAPQGQASLPDSRLALSDFHNQTSNWRACLADDGGVCGGERYCDDRG